LLLLAAAKYMPSVIAINVAAYTGYTGLYRRLPRTALALREI